MKTHNRFGIVMAAIALLSACASSETGVGGDGDDVYPGAGRGATLGEAMSAAKMDAVRRGVIDVIGEESERLNADLLDEVIYSTSTPNAFVYNETLETVRRDGSLIDGDLYYELRIRVNMDALRTTLEANGIRRGTGTGGVAGGGSGVGGDAAADSVTTLSPASLRLDDDRPPSPGEERFISRYLARMTYMVSFSDRNRYADPQMQFLMKSAVAQANGYILADGRTAIDAEQVERLKEDQRLIYEEETGQEISLLQWVARRLNADLYIEVDAAVDARTSGGSHYGRADVTLTMYEASTGQLLGSVNRRSQESYSRISQDDAIINALQATVYQAMPDVLEMSQRQMSIALRRGLRYDLTIQNPPDSRSVSLFRRALEQEVREIRTVSQVAQEVRYEVFLVGDTDDLVDLVSIVSGEVAGFEDLYLVISRGRAVTFDAGY